MSHHRKSRKTIEQNREDVEWNGNYETPQNNYLLKVTNPKTRKKYSCS